MQTSRFQLGLIATLAVGLGVSLASTQAIGYPAGAAVSHGADPVVSTGATALSGDSDVLFSAPSDQDVVLTDIVLTSTSTMECKRTHRTVVSLSSGPILGEFETNSGVSRQWSDYDSDPGLSVSHSYGSGLRIPAGDSATLSVSQTGASGSGCGSSTSYGVRYSVSGYHAQP